MTYYRYRIRDAEGQLLEGELEAISADALAGQLQAGGAVPISIREIAAPAKAQPKRQLRFRSQPRVGLDDLILFCRQMYTLVRAGVPLTRSLRGLVETARNPTLGEALEAVVESLESGQDLSGALSLHSRIFPPLLCRMVQVGEHSGQLEEAFYQLAVYFEREKETINRVKSALRYPSFVVVAIALAIAFLSLFVIPAFEKVFAGFGAELPWATRLLLAISGFTVSYWPLLLALLLGGIGLTRQLLKTERGRFLWDRYKLKIPLAGDIILRSTLVRFARAFNMGFSAGVPLVQALGFTARAVDNLFVGERIERMRNSIERGENLTNSAAQAEMFTPLVLQMLAVGEETGSIDTMLNDVAEFYEREVDYDLKNLSSLIEPILIVAIGGMVLVLALGVFLPIWDLSRVAR